MTDFLKSYFCFNKKFLVYNLVDRNMKVKYRRSFLGVFWTILGPVSLALVYYLVFKVILRVEKENYLILVVSGVMSWSLFAQTLSETMGHYVEQQGLITKIYFPIQAFTLTTTMTNAITLLASIPLIVGMAIYNGVIPNSHLFFLPLYLLSLGLLTYSCSLIAAWLFVFLRDLRQLIGIILQLLFYATPVLYTIDMVPERFRNFYKYNPLSTIISGVQNSVLGRFDHEPLQIFVLVAWIIGLGILSGYLVIGKRTAVVENL